MKNFRIIQGLITCAGAAQAERTNNQVQHFRDQWALGGVTKIYKCIWSAGDKPSASS
jgi:hypothetical protein